MKLQQLITLGILISSSFVNAQEHKMNHSTHNPQMHQMHNMSSNDTRTPIPMTAQMSQHQLSNMRDHLEAIQEAVSAMATKNFDQMKKASKKLASSPEMTQMCEHMGKGTPGYTEMGLALHKSGDELVHAAEKKNYDLFVKKLGATLQTCTACHAAFKQEVVPDSVFQKLQSKTSSLNLKIKSEEMRWIQSYIAQVK